MNVNFSEIFLIAVIALIVIKPERLPEIALMLGKWIKRVRESVAKIKNELEGSAKK